MTFSRAFPVVSSLVFANSWYIREPHVFGGGNFLKIRGWHPVPSTPVRGLGFLGNRGMLVEYGGVRDDSGLRRPLPGVQVAAAKLCHGRVGCKACAAGARYATFILSTYLFLTPRWVLRAPAVKLWGVTTRSKVRSYANCPTFTLHFTLSGQVLTILHTKPENGL